MIKNIEWPEGTMAHYGSASPIDYYSDDFPHGTLDFDIDKDSSYKSPNKYIALKEFNSSELVRLNSWCRGMTIGPIFPIDVSSLSVFNVASMPTEMVLSGSNSNITGLNITLTTDSFTPKVWIPYDGDFSPFKQKYPNFNYIQYGNFPIQLRILKDGQWMDGTELVAYNFTNMDYIGNGIYELNMNIEPKGRYMFPLKAGGYRKSVRALPTTQIVTIGSLGNAVHKYEGENILNIVVDNPNGWYYDAEIGGVRNNIISDNQKTQMKIEVPNNEITITYGQDSENKYDYCVVYDGNMNGIMNFKGINTEDSQITLISNTNSFIFEYKKDSSNSKGKDAFWIKSIEYFELPPFPEN